MFNPFKSLIGQLNGIKRSFKDTMNSIGKLGGDVANIRALRTYSPETEALIEKISASEEGVFLLNSGVLSSDEIENLSRLQLANFLAGSGKMVEMIGRDGFTEGIPEIRKGILKGLAKQKAAGG